MKSMQSYANIAKWLVIILIILILVGCFIFNFLGSPISSDTTKVNFTVESGDTYFTVAPKLKTAGLIRSESFFKLYVKLTKPSNLQAGIFTLSKNMSVKDIINTFDGANGKNSNIIRITFKENINMWDLAQLIENNTNNTKEDVYNKLKDTTYIDSLISRYSFLSKDIKDTDIYYPLEGYLEPNTYEFASKDVTVEDIFKTLLDQRQKTLTKYKDQIDKSKYSIHQLLTLASIVEAEAGSNDDMPNIASVFYNRLDIKMPLGSDVTTYYAEKLDLGARDLTAKEVSDCNAYNTRAACMAGKLPIGPIGNPSEVAINAVLNPADTNYYYFVADKNGKIYYNMNIAGHNATIAKLKAEGLWYEY